MATRRRYPVPAALVAAASLAYPASAMADEAAPTPPAPVVQPALPPGAQPAPPPGGQPAPLPGGIGNVLAQAGNAPTGPLGLPDLSAYSTAMLLGQNPVPSAPGAAGQPVVPNLSAFNAQYLVPQNIAPAPPGEGDTATGLGPDGDNPGTGRIAFLRRLHEMYAAGDLKGALLGQVPPEEFDDGLANPASG